MILLKELLSTSVKALQIIGKSFICPIPTSPLKDVLGNLKFTEEDYDRPKALISQERASNTSIPGGWGRAAEIHSWAVLKMWACSHISVEISVQDVARTLMEMDLLFFLIF